MALFKVEPWFLQHVRRWLKTTSDATQEWVENAIKQDEVFLEDAETRCCHLHTLFDVVPTSQ